jgi:hypothetical protein
MHCHWFVDFCGLQVTDVHVVLYNTLMFCGITPEMLFGPTEERSVKQAQKGGAPNSMKMPGNTKTPENVMSVREAATHGPAVEERINGKASKQMSVSKSAICETDAKKAPKRLTQKHMLQWIADRDGVSTWNLLGGFLLSALVIYLDGPWFG